MISSDLFEEAEGEFWGILETRPYMRAVYGLADALAAVGKHTEAIDHLKELLRLNPGDNQGARYLLLRELLTTGDNAGVMTLLREYPDEFSAMWRYGLALVKFRLMGDNLFARRSLLTALTVNEYVPPYLLGSKRLPRRMPPYYGMGDESEAQWYALEQRRTWQETPGALDWLRQVRDSPGDMMPGPGDLVPSLPKDGNRPAVLDPAGPGFFLNLYEHIRYTKCPACDRKTKLRQRYLVVILEPAAMIVVKTGIRYCDHCDLVVHADELELGMMKALDMSYHELIGNDYVPIGLLDSQDMRRRPEGPLDPNWAMERLQKFRSYEEFEDPWEAQYGAFLDALGPLPGMGNLGPELVRETAKPTWQH